MGIGDTTRNLIFKFLGDSKSLERASQRSRGSLGKMDEKVGGSSKKLGLMQTAAGKLGGVLAVGALFKGIGSAIGRAEEMDSKYTITKQIIEDTGGAANLTGEEVKEMSKEMSLATGLDKGVITDAANVLLTFKEINNTVGDGNDLFTQALTLTGDMATVFGGDAKDAAKQLGKALNDPIGGISALSRVGVQFTEDQKAVIKSFVEVGDVASAQKIILGELESQVGGTAVASADATAIMGVAFSEVTEIIGAELLPAIQEIAPAVVQMVESASPAIQELAGVVGAYASDQVEFSEGLATAADESKGFMDRVGGAADAVRDATVAGLKWNVVTGPMIAGLGKMKDGMSQVDDTTSRLDPRLRDLADTTRAYADESDDATEAVDSLADAQRKMVDPVFKARDAEKKFIETLAKVREDGILTADELDDVAQAHLDLQFANEQVTPENMEAYRDVIQEVKTDVVNDAGLIEQSIGRVGSKDNLAEISGFLQRLDDLTGQTIQIDLSGLRMASRSELEQAVTRTIFALQRRGVIRNVFV